MPVESVDILVIGAGPSGTVAAAAANQRGMKVKVIEKQRFPRFIIGESLLPKCMEHFEEVGLLDVLKKQNYQVKRGVRFLRGDKTCWFNFAEQFSSSWSWTWQVPRADFDKVLADEVSRQGVDIQYEAEVIDVELDGGKSRTTVKLQDGSTSHIDARYIIDASGYGRVLPRLFGLNRDLGSPPRKAIFGHFTDGARPEGPDGQQITFVIHKRDVWIWVIPFSTGVTSVGFVGNPDYLAQFEDENVNVHLRRLMNDVPYVQQRFVNEAAEMQAKSIKAYTVSTSQTHGPGYVISGNSSEFIDPVFSSGVTFATESGLLAAKLACRSLNGEHVDWDVEYNEHMKQGVETFRTYVNQWYEGDLQDIFFYTNGDVNQTIKRQICSVLAGNVWDINNPFVGPKRERALSSVAKIIKLY
jgi:flavin-dependent dehydrogenase